MSVSMPASTPVPEQVDTRASVRFPPRHAVAEGKFAEARMSAPGVQPPRLMVRVRQAIRARHLSRSTEDAYAAWIRRFILFHDKRHPDEMGEKQVGEFLSHLATQRHVSASTQNQ